MKLHRALLASAVVLLFGSYSFAVLAEGAFDRTLNVGAGSVNLDVQTGSGSIIVRGGSGNTVTVHGKIQARDNWLRDSGLSAEEKVKKLQANPPIQQSGNSVRVGRVDDEALRNNVSISYEIVTPRDAVVHSTSGSGSQQVSDISGSLRITAGSGSLKAENIGGEIHVNTGSGSIHINNTRARVYAEAGSGSIEALGVGGGFSAHTGSGEIRFEQTAPGEVQVDTGSGSIRLKNVRGSLEAGTGSGSIEAQGEIAGDWRLHSGSGSVQVELPQSAKFDLDARSGSGGVTVDHSITMKGTLRRNHIQGAVNGGGTRLDISTSSGSIHVL